MTAGILAIGILIAGSFAQASQPGIRSIATGAAHSFAVKNDGTLWAWGWNLYGQLGVDSSIAHLSPSQVGAATDWAAVTAGGNHTRALQSDLHRSARGVRRPPNHQMVAVGITGVSDPDNDATITITGVTQDEPTDGLGDGDTAIDAVINNDGTVLLRAERSGKGDGRVYRVSFTAADLEGSASGVVLVKVPHYMKKPAIESGGLIDSTN